MLPVWRSLNPKSWIDRTSTLHPQPSARGATPGLELGMGLWDGAVWCTGRPSVVLLCAGLDE